jgi:hypothetical protein
MPGRRQIIVAAVGRLESVQQEYFGNVRSPPEIFRAVGLALRGHHLKAAYDLAVLAISGALWPIAMGVASAAA